MYYSNYVCVDMQILRDAHKRLVIFEEGYFRNRISKAIKVKFEVRVSYNLRPKILKLQIKKQ
jgi:hypothetical protein